MKLGHLQARYFGNKMFNRLKNLPPSITDIIATEGSEEDVKWWDDLLEEFAKAQREANP